MKRIGLALLAALLCLAPSAALSEAQYPTTWNYYTVDNPNGPTVITGINNLGKVVGYWTKDGANTATTSQAPYAGWSKIGYPGATSCIAAGLSNTFMQVGYCQTTTGSTFGYIRDHGHYSASAATTVYLGTNHVQCLEQTENCHGNHVPNPDPLVVGYQKVPNQAVMQATELDVTTQAVTVFSPPGAVSSKATGINGHGYVVGFMDTAKDGTEGWIYRNGVYHVLVYPGARSTKARGLNWQDEVVGDYKDASGVTHGFFVSKPTESSPVWVSIDYPGAARTTVRSINDHSDFVGSYVDSAGITHGFLAQPTP